MGCQTRLPPSPGLNGIYKTEREKYKLPSHFIYTACEDASERLDSFQKLKRRGRAYTEKPSVRRVTVHLDDHLWKFSLDNLNFHKEE
jgi:putative transposase